MRAGWVPVTAARCDARLAPWASHGVTGSIGEAREHGRNDDPNPGGAGAPSLAKALRKPDRLCHLGKVLFEHSWMGAGLDHAAAQVGLILGGKLLGVPVTG